MTRRPRKSVIRAVAAQLDINPSGTDSQFYQPAMIRDLKGKCFAHVWEGELRYDTLGNPAEFVRAKDGKLRLWVHLRGGMPPPSDYDMGIDVSLGSGASSSCISIGDSRTGEKVAEYVDNNIDPKDLGILAVALARSFRNEDDTGAKIAWEHHGPGTSTGKMIWITLGYLNVYRAVDENRTQLKKSDTPGVRMSGKESKLELHVEYRSALQCFCSSTVPCGA